MKASQIHRKAIMYANVMMANDEVVSNYLFADDTFLYIVGSDLPTMCRQMSEDLQSLLQYCQGNKLKVHPKNFNAC
jgi:hypothetical protein